AVGFDAEPGQSAGAVIAFDELRQLVQPPARELFSSAVDLDPADESATFGRAAKNAELDRLGDLGDVDDLQTVPQVRLIAAEPTHRFLERHPRQWRWNVAPQNLLGDALHQSIDDAD